jgi:hypothetical protein
MPKTMSGKAKIYLRFFIVSTSFLSKEHYAGRIRSAVETIGEFQLMRFMGSSFERKIRRNGLQGNRAPPPIHLSTWVEVCVRPSNISGSIFRTPSMRPGNTTIL